MLRAITIAILAMPVSAMAALKTPAQNRLHIGSAWTPGSTHVQVGFDSRMSSSIFVDVGAFISPMDATKPGDDNVWVLRHGIYVDPGIRIPHRNKGDFKWDIILRGGFAPIWMANTSTNNKQQIMPALNGGADLMFRYKDWGLRMGYRAWYSKPIDAYEKASVQTVRPQIATSLLYEF